MRFVVLLTFVFLSFATVAQKQVQLTMSKDELMAKRKEIQEAINETERQLEAIKSDKKATMGQLRALQNKLAERQNLIANINEEIGDIDNTIRSSSKEVQNLRQKLDQLKIRYAQSIRYSYETRSSYDMLAFLFSSRDFNDAIRRMKYLKKFRDYRKQQVDQIHVTQNQLQHKIGVLNNVKKQKDELLNAQVEQKQSLLKETDQTNKVIQELKGKESDMMKKIERDRIIARRVDKYINMIIEREIAKAAKQAEEEAKKKEAATAKTEKPATEHAPSVSRTHVKTETQELFLTPSDIALANNFEGNKGKLYWPVEKGYISDHFGTHPHPIETKVMINNDGVDIQTAANATVKAVFEGTVTSVATIEGVKMVLIKHGNFYTVYNNLASVSVSKDQHVNTNQPIGVVANNDYGDPTVKFQIWKANGRKAPVKLNPEQWLARPK